MDQLQFNSIVSFIWGIADDCLRDVYVRGKYRDVILPMTVIRRLDAVLEKSKPDVLAMKAILGLGAFAQAAGILGETDDAEYFRAVAEKFAAEWLKAADGGECTRLAFDQAGSWSQKYNLVYDRLLELKLFPASLAEREVAFYRAHQNRYGLPLDSQADYTKLDWLLYCACLTGKDDDFQALLSPVIDFLKESPSRVPMTDWYDTGSGAQVGFQARSVVGGLFIRLLYDSETVASWRRGR